MTIEITGTLADGKFPRILHSGNRATVKTITASAEQVSYPGDAADNGSTVDRWRPFANQISDPSDLSETTWTATRFSVGTGGEVLDEGTDAATTRFIRQTFTFTAVEWVVSAKVQRLTMDGFQLVANDGTTDFTCDFDLRTGVTAGTTGGATGKIIDLGGGFYECLIYFTPVAAAGHVQITGWDGADTTTYTGTNRTIKILRVAANVSEATLRYDLFSAAGADCVCLSATNLWSSGARLVLQHDSNNDDTWTDIDTVTPADNGPVMILFDEITSSRWRIKIDRGVLPEIGVFWLGSALKFERPFYSGFTIPRMNRQTSVRGNLSSTGELLGRSKKRTVLTAEYSWNNLTYQWVRDNLDGVNGLIQSAESEPLFVAWRPSETQDVEYLMRASVTAPSAQGQRDLHAFGMTGEAWAYE